MSMVISQINDCVKEEIALPGNWSSQIFHEDLKVYPIDNKVTASMIAKTNVGSMSYLDFFQKTRGFPRKGNRKVWNVFEKGMVMMYFENVFLNLVFKETLSKADDIVLKYIDLLSQVHISRWNDILKGIDCVCYQFFAKDPYNYVNHLLRDT